MLHYDSDTGIFTWAISLGAKKAGTVAGALSLGYINIGIDNKDYGAHRLAFLYMLGKFPKHQVDHKDHNRSNNTWSNLRAVTHGENARNTSKRSDNTSGVTGVSWDKTRGKWTARIKVDGKYKYLGRFIEFNDAVSARISANTLYSYHENHGSANA